MKFACPYCQQPLEADDAFAGATIDCPACGQPLVIGAPPADAGQAPSEQSETRSKALPVFRVVSRPGKTESPKTKIILDPLPGFADKARGLINKRHKKKWLWSLAVMVVLATLKCAWPTRSAGTTKTIKLPGGATMEMVWCPPGKFSMGTAGFQREVTLTKGFWMAKTEVTQRQWQSVMATTLREQRDKADWNRPILGEGADYPMYYVNWQEAKAFCKKANLQLPTEAQWEYACRAGSTKEYGGTGKLLDMGWFGGNSGNTTHPAAQKQPNAWGLYDMHGNVWEWCADHHELHTDIAPTDPIGATSGMFLGRCGGAWISHPGQCRSGYRDGFIPENRESFMGFRPIALP